MNDKICPFIASDSIVTTNNECIEEKCKLYDKEVNDCMLVIMYMKLLRKLK